MDNKYFIIDLERGLITYRCCECGNHIDMTLDEIRTANEQVPA